MIFLFFGLYPLTEKLPSPNLTREDAHRMVDELYDQVEDEETILKNKIKDCYEKLDEMFDLVKERLSMSMKSSMKSLIKKIAPDMIAFFTSDLEDIDPHEKISQSWTLLINYKELYERNSTDPLTNEIIKLRYLALELYELMSEWLALQEDNLPQKTPHDQRRPSMAPLPDIFNRSKVLTPSHKSRRSMSYPP